MHVLKKDDQGVFFAQTDKKILHCLERAKLPPFPIQCLEQRIVHPERQQTPVKRNHRSKILCDSPLNLTSNLFYCHSLFDAKDRLYHIDHGEKVDIPAVLDADTGEKGRFFTEGRLKLVREAAFPNTRLPDHIHHLPLPLFRPIEH